MNNRLKQIIANRDTAIREFEEFKKNYGLCVDLGISSISLDRTWGEKATAFDKADAEFWKALESPLEIFDILKGEKPNDGEEVMIYNERSSHWFSLKYDVTKNTFYDKRLPERRLYYTIDEAHRWTRLPILDKE